MGFLELINKKSTRYWIFQVSGWGAYGVLLYLSLYKSATQVLWQQATLLLFSSIQGMLFSHQIRKFLIRKRFYDFEAKNFLIPVLLAAFIASAAHSLVTKLLGGFILPGNFNWDWLTLSVNTSAMFMIYLLWSAVYFSFLLIEETQRKQLNFVLLSKTQVELELQILRSQLNPHFLFNALNAIRALVDLDPKRARESITLLSNLLRNTLKINTEKSITLEQELEIVNAYLALEKVRFEERLEFYVEIDDSCQHLDVPSLLIQTLVENAIKHGISKRIKGGEVHISLSCQDDTIKILVTNDGTLGKEVDLGIGLSNLKKRLYLQYGENFLFSLTENNEKVEAKVILPLSSKLER
jgi:two-component system, LytTR family, sensor kinase